MQSQMSGDRPASNILNQPQHILSFIKHALEANKPPAAEQKVSSQAFGIESLRIVPESQDTNGDSDDEDDEASITGQRDEEMTATAINLLLSLLECTSLFHEPILIKLTSLEYSPSRAFRSHVTCSERYFLAVRACIEGGRRRDSSSCAGSEDGHDSSACVYF